VYLHTFNIGVLDCIHLMGVVIKVLSCSLDSNGHRHVCILCQ